ncbi:MAG: T9SS type A sorting domain-containing protein [Bacteroidota bacterium]
MMLRHSLALLVLLSGLSGFCFAATSPSVPQVRIPIVFHIVQSVDAPLVDEDRVLRQLELLNQAFSLAEYETYHPSDPSLAPTYELVFCLPALDPYGSTTTGIQFVESEGDFSVFDAIKKPSLDGVAAWLTDRYVNVWVGDLGDWHGHVQLPGSEPSTDGIVVDYRYFGGEEAELEGATLGQLMATYLGLTEFKMDGHCLGQAGVDCFGPGHRYLFSYSDVNKMLEAFQLEGLRYGLLSTVLQCAELRTSVEEISALQMKVFPVPAEDRLTLSIALPDEGELQIRLLDALGSVHYEAQYEQTKGIHREEIDCSHWPVGVYFAHIRLGDQTAVQQVSIYHP